jgi:hypothetical protein
LQGLQVTDTNAPGGRIVPVRFRLPETEVADLTFPLIVIDHDGWYPAPEREHRGYIQLPYAPEGFNPWWADTGPATTTFQPSDSPYWSFIPIPYNLDYYVTVYTRIMHEHTIPLVSQLAAYDRLHPKFAFLDVPQDGTKRTLQLLGGPSLIAEYDNNGKRFFQIKYKIRVFSELVPQIAQYPKVTSMNIDLSVYDDITDLTGEGLAESIGLLSVGGPSIAWNTDSNQ